MILSENRFFDTDLTRQNNPWHPKSLSLPDILRNLVFYISTLLKIFEIEVSIVSRILEMQAAGRQLQGLCRAALVHFWNIAPGRVSSPYDNKYDFSIFKTWLRRPNHYSAGAVNPNWGRSRDSPLRWKPPKGIKDSPKTDQRKTMQAPKNDPPHQRESKGGLYAQELHSNQGPLCYVTGHIVNLISIFICDPWNLGNLKSPTFAVILEIWEVRSLEYSLWSWKM